MTKKGKLEDVLTSTLPEKADTPVPKEVGKPTEPSPKNKVAKEVHAVEEETPVELPITFDRWFRSKGFKFHWIEGMRAYTDTSKKRTKTQWDLTFKNY